MDLMHVSPNRILKTLKAIILIMDLRWNIGSSKGHYLMDITYQILTPLEVVIKGMKTSLLDFGTEFMTAWHQAMWYIAIGMFL